MANYFNGRDHVTTLRGKVSSFAAINVSIILQGSVMGPSFVVEASDIHPLHNFNAFVKFSDDSYPLIA